MYARLCVNVIYKNSIIRHSITRGDRFTYVKFMEYRITGLSNEVGQVVNRIWPPHST